MMDHNEMIAVIQAQRDGKQIEGTKADGTGGWFSIGPAEGFDFQNYTYRIKPPVPREWWILPNGEANGGIDVISDRARLRGMIHVREIIS